MPNRQSSSDKVTVELELTGDEQRAVRHELSEPYGHEIRVGVMGKLRAALSSEQPTQLACDCCGKPIGASLCEECRAADDRPDSSDQATQHVEEDDWPITSAPAPTTCWVCGGPFPRPDCGCKAAVLDSGHCDGCGQLVVPSDDRDGPDCEDGAEIEAIVGVAVESFERRISRLQFELQGRLTFEEARDRMLKEIEGARQGHVTLGRVNGNLFGNTADPDHKAADQAERRINQGVQVLDLGDFNAALDRAFPAPVSNEEEGER